MIAHRGASAQAPENTLLAFRQAAELGAHAIELDAKLTRDGHVVVHHDQTLERTTNGVGPLRARTLEELRRLDAGLFKDARFAGQQIPTLREVFEQLGERLLINVELTHYATPWDGLPDAVISLISEFDLWKRVLISSFNPFALQRVRRRAPALVRGLLVLTNQPPLLRALMCWWLAPQAYHPPLAILRSESIARQHSRGRTVNVWTVNEEPAIETALQMGVDGVITDVPGRARHIVERFTLGRRTHWG